MEAFLLLCNAVLTFVIVYMAIRDDKRENQTPKSFFKTKADNLISGPPTTTRSRSSR